MVMRYLAGIERGEESPSLAFPVKLAEVPGRRAGLLSILRRAKRAGVAFISGIAEALGMAWRKPYLNSRWELT